MTIRRDVAGAAGQRFDVIIVGGGVYGAMLLLQASLRGLRGVLVERDDFGGATSWNHLRIVHGGLRYLQRLDLVRHRESVAERRRFLTEFGDFVQPLPCWMPLDWRGIRNPLVLSAAAKIDDWLSWDRNRGVAPARHLARASVVSRRQAGRHTEGWGIPEPGAALRWFDSFLPRPRRLLMEILHRACAGGGLALNYVEALTPVVADGKIQGLAARDRVGGVDLELSAPLLLNAAGPEARDLAERWHATAASAVPRTLAWNVLLDVAPGFDEALAVAAPRRGAPVSFLVPWEGRILAGTGHAAASDVGGPAVPERHLVAFLRDLDAALPGLGIAEDRVLRVYSGFLPGTRAGSAELSDRPLIVDHARVGGPRGLWSVSGVKFTTARRVADLALRRAAGDVADEALAVQAGAPGAGDDRKAALRFGPDWQSGADPDGTAILKALIQDEAVMHLDDLLLRRTSLGEDPRTARALAPELVHWFGADEATRTSELARVEQALAGARAPLE